MIEFMTILILIFQSTEVPVGVLPTEKDCSALIAPTYEAFKPVKEFVGVRCERTGVLASSPRPLPKPEGVK